MSLSHVENHIGLRYLSFLLNLEKDHAAFLQSSVFSPDTRGSRGGLLLYSKYNMSCKRCCLKARGHLNHLQRTLNTLEFHSWQVTVWCNEFIKAFASLSSFFPTICMNTMLYSLCCDSNNTKHVDYPECFAVPRDTLFFVLVGEKSNYSWDTAEKEERWTVFWGLYES